MDYWLERLINSAAGHHPLADGAMVLTVTYSEPIFVGVVLLWALVALARRSAGELTGAATALLASGLALLINLAISELWFRPRPFAAHPATVTLLVRHSADASFPSDHAAAGMAIASVLLAFHRRIGALCIAFAVFMALARVYAGEHYPGDVGAGLAIGLAAAVALLRLHGLLRPAIERRRRSR